MISVMELILGYEFGKTSYDDIIAAGALMLGVMSILLVINIFKHIIGR